MKYEIRDWANKLCFKGVSFDSFEEGWEYIYEHDPMPEIEDDSWFSDYYVLPVERGAK
jgi:hypothetical protein